MAGHNKWKQIKHQKGAADKKRGRLFSKLANLIAIAAKKDPNPQFNPTLRSTIERARSFNLPQANIDRAIERAKESEDLEELVLEIYGPEGSGLLVDAVTDNRNRTTNEVRALLKDYDAKLATPGSLAWAFERDDSDPSSATYKAKFPQSVTDEAREKIEGLILALEERDDVNEIYTNITE